MLQFAQLIVCGRQKEKVVYSDFMYELEKIQQLGGDLSGAYSSCL